MANPQFDEIGYWSEVKLEILASYGRAYSTILAAQKHPPLSHIYIDAFAGSGTHISRSTGDLVPGSPANALNIKPPFDEYHLIDTNPQKIAHLEEMVRDQPGVHIYQGDCNKILLDEVFPRVRYDEYKRGLCILDPYGLDLSWDVIRTAGQMKSLDIFLNFPVLDMNRNVLWHDSEKVDPAQTARLNYFWGDNSWKDAAYETANNLFGFPEKQTNDVIADAFRRRLKDIAGFIRVPPPLPMRNSKGGIVYYLYFASQKNTAEHIVLQIFEKFKNRGEK
jgi:three-Cys-motif partner protein